MTWREKEYPLNYQEPFAVYNASLAFNHPDGKWSLSVYGRNLTHYAEKVMYSGKPVFQTRVGNPRTFGGVLFVRF